MNKTFYLKMIKRVDWFNIVLILVVIVALVLLILQNTLFNNVLSITETPRTFGITGHATESTTISNVTIAKYLSISLCTNLSDGIIFGNITTLPATNVNATHNYDGASTGSTMCVNVSEDANTAIDFCTKANDHLTSVGADTIELGNETYANSTVTSAGTPGAAANSTAVTTSYVKSGNAVAAGGVNYYRFWLDVPASQPSGDYNNTVYFKGVTTTLACG